MAEGFQNYFYSFAKGSCDPGAWRPYFLEYDADLWNREEWGRLSFTSEDGLTYHLWIVHLPTARFVVRFECRTPEQRPPLESKLAVGDASRLHQFIEFNDLVYCEGCFVDPQRAWKIVEDFLEFDPERPSVRAQWVDLADIRWPDIESELENEDE